MAEISEAVSIIRKIIPKEGLQTDRPSRLKSKIKKSLDQRGIHSTTIRGIGRQIGDYAVVYEEKENLFYAKFTLMSELQKSLPNKGKKTRGKGKKQELFTGRHPSTVNMSVGDYAKAIVEELPEDWTQTDSIAHRWLSTDVSLLLNIQHSPEMAAQYLIRQASENLHGRGNDIHFTVIKAFEQILIGIGPII